MQLAVIVNFTAVGLWISLLENDNFFVPLYLFSDNCSYNCDLNELTNAATRQQRLKDAETGWMGNMHLPKIH